MWAFFTNDRNLGCTITTNLARISNSDEKLGCATSNLAHFSQNDRNFGCVTTNKAHFSENDGKIYCIVTGAKFDGTQLKFDFAQSKFPLLHQKCTINLLKCNLNRRHTGKLRKRGNSLTWEGGRGWVWAESYDRKKALVLYKSYNHLCFYTIQPKQRYMYT